SPLLTMTDLLRVNLYGLPISEEFEAQIQALQTLGVYVENTPQRPSDSDVDSDGIVDNIDTDIDNDGVLNANDFAPFNPTVTTPITYISRDKSNLNGPYHGAYIQRYDFDGTGYLGDQATRTQLLINGDFENGLVGWRDDNLGSVIVENGNNIFEAIIDTATVNIWEINQSNIFDIIEGATYELSYRAKASQARTLYAGLGLNGGDYNDISETVSLTTEWQTFTTEVVANGIGGSGSRVLFDMGIEIGNVYLDDVNVFLTSLPKTSYNFTYEGFTLTKDIGSTQWIYSVYDLVYYQVLDQQAADDFVSANGDFLERQELVTVSSRQDFRLIDDGIAEDTFEVLTTNDYRLTNNDNDFHERIFNTDGPFKVEQEETLYLLDVNAASKLALGHSELNGQSLAITALPGDTLTADIFDFNADGTGIATIANVAFTWSEEIDGRLLMTYADIGDGRSAQIWLSAFEQFNEGYEVYVDAEVDGLPLVNYTYAVFDNGNHDVSAYLGQYLDTELGHPLYYRENGEHVLSTFSFKLNNDGTANNFAFDGNGYFDNRGDDNLKYTLYDLPRYWEQLGSEVVITTRFQNNSYFANCELNVDGCIEVRRRTWTPITSDGNRLWVVEKREFLTNAFDSPAEIDEVWETWIPPRINFYTLRDLNNGFADKMVNLAIRNELLVNLDTPIDLSTITDVNLSGYPITDLTGIEQLTGLERISLAETQVTDLSPLLTMTDLLRVNLYGLPITEELEAQIQALQNVGVYVELRISSALEADLRVFTDNEN
ncbi:MAG: carbohydrate binding domain-containing protein, partial [Alteromonadaceae bacterium]